MIQAPGTISSVTATISSYSKAMWHLLMAQQQESFHPFSSKQSLSCFLSHVARGATQSHVVLTLAQATGAPPGMAAMPGFKSQHQSSSAAPFPIPPTISYTCQHSHILPALLGCHSKSGQVWPLGMEPIIFKLSRRCCNQGELPPSYVLGGSHFHPPSSKHGHSYLTYP